MDTKIIFAITFSKERQGTCDAKNKAVLGELGGEKRGGGKVEVGYEGRFHKHNIASVAYLTKRGVGVGVFKRVYICRRVVFMGKIYHW